MNATPGEHDTSRPASIWEDFVDIYFTPSRVFERRRDGRLWPALIVLTLVLTALSVAYFSALSAAYDADMARALARSGSDVEVPEMITAAGRGIATYGSLVFVPIGVVITGVLLLLVGRLFGAELTFALGATIATYAAFPRLLQTLFGTLQGLLLNPDSMSRVSTGPVRFLDPETAPETLVALLARFDLFIIWTVILTAIGVRIIGGTTGSRAWATAIVVWVIGSIPAIVGLVIAS